MIKSTKKFIRKHDTIFGRMALVTVITLILAQILNVIVLIGLQKFAYIARQETEAITQFVERIPEALGGVATHETLYKTNGTQSYVITDIPVVTLNQSNVSFPKKNAELSRRLRRNIGASNPSLLMEPNQVRVQVLEGPLRQIFAGGIFTQFGVPQLSKDQPNSTNTNQATPTIGQIHFRALIMSVRVKEDVWLNSLHFTRQTEQGLGWRIALGSAVLIILSLFIMLWFIRKIAKPFRVLANAADDVRKGSTGVNIDEVGSGDIRRTINAFNALNASRDKLIETQQSMIGAVGHDLKTPLTILRLCAEKVQDPSNKTRMINSIEETQFMLDSILQYTQESTTPENMTKVDIFSLIDVLCSDYKDMGRPVEYKSELAGLSVSVRTGQFKRALRNLIENALKYGGRADVFAIVENGNLYIRVEDDGLGVPDTELKRILEPFQRGEKSRNRETGGTGLGLPIVQTIIEGHGGHLKISNRPEGGFCSEIILPL